MSTEMLCGISGVRSATGARRRPALMRDSVPRMKMRISRLKNGIRGCVALEMSHLGVFAVSVAEICRELPHE